MVNPEIVTALKNALDHGESLEEAKQVLINSGYSMAEIQEASYFIGGGVTHIQQIKPGEELAMSRPQGILGKFAKPQRPSSAKVIMPNHPMQMPASRQISQQFNQPLQQIQQQRQIQLPPQTQYPAPPQQQFAPRPSQQSASTNQIQRLVQQSSQQSQTPQQPNPSLTQNQSTDSLTDSQMLDSIEYPKPEINPSDFPKPEKNLTNEIAKIKPIGESHTKEIVLFIILLILITILVLSFIFKDKIISLFGFFLGLI